MSRLTIEVTGQEHQQIKAMAAMQGKTIKEYVMERVFLPAENEEEKAWGELKHFLNQRIESANKGNLSSKTVSQITDDILK